MLLWEKETTNNPRRNNSNHTDNKQNISQYIEVYYNRVRRHSAIGSIAPEVFENQCKIESIHSRTRKTLSDLEDKRSNAYLYA